MPRNTSAGRVGALDEARSLVALVASLSESGDALSVDAVARRLCVTPDYAKKLIELVCLATTQEDISLPLIADDGEQEVTLNLMRDSLRGRRLKLTRSETIALVAALKQLGTDTTDPLLIRLTGALSDTQIDQNFFEQCLGNSRTTDPELTKLLQTCSLARVQNKELHFLYQKTPYEDKELRRVITREMRHEDELWYLDAYDLERKGLRTFRLDRMMQATLHPLTPHESHNAAEARTFVQITFHDPSYLNLLEWHDLEQIQCLENGSVIARTPYYGGSWLVRMLAACGGTATTDNDKLNAAVQAYVRAQLTQAHS